jgi:hypothetical protein
MLPLRFLLVVPFATLLGCGGGTGRFDSRTRAILAGATKVEVFRTDGKDGPYDGKPRQEGERRIGGFRVIAQGPDQARPFAAKLAEVLLNEKFDPSGAKCFWPGVSYRVWKDDEYADVLICFSCHNLYCGPPKEEVMENAGFSASRVRSKLVRLAREALPEDKEVQELKDD